MLGNCSLYVKSWIDDAIEPWFVTLSNFSLWVGVLFVSIWFKSATRLLSKFKWITLAYDSFGSLIILQVVGSSVTLFCE
jgi:hypothetical protein